MQKVNTVIIGAGHSGLAVSYLLTKKSVEHIILEKGQIGETWRSKTWDSLRMVLPNWMTLLPGFHYKGNKPDGFDSKKEYITYLETYAKSFNAPVKNNIEVQSLKKEKAGFALQTNNGIFRSKNVVVATGGLQKIARPSFASKLLKSIAQLNSTDYKNPKQLEKGGVLIIGAGNSGVQIAKELVEHSFPVYLSVSKVRHMPRKYRGKDAIHWLQILGKLDVTAESLPSKEAQKVIPLLMIGQENVDLNLNNLARKGLKLLGKINNVQQNILNISPDLKDNLTFADTFYDTFTKMVDDYILKNKLDAPPPERSKPKPIQTHEIKDLDLKKENIKTVIWATGFYNDFSWIKLDILDKDGDPIHTKGVSKEPGLYFIGLKWLSKYKSNFIYGVGEDAKHIVSLL